MGGDLSDLSAQNIGEEILDAAASAADAWSGGTGGEYIRDVKEALNQPIPDSSGGVPTDTRIDPIVDLIDRELAPPLAPEPAVPAVPVPAPTPVPPTPVPPTPVPPTPVPPTPVPPTPVPPTPVPPQPRILRGSVNRGFSNEDSNTMAGMRLGQPKTNLWQKIGEPTFRILPGITYYLVGIIASVIAHLSVNVIQMFANPNSALDFRRRHLLGYTAYDYRFAFAPVDAYYNQQGQLVATEYLPGAFNDRGDDLGREQLLDANLENRVALEAVGSIHTELGQNLRFLRFARWWTGISSVSEQASPAQIARAVAIVKKLDQILKVTTTPAPAFLVGGVFVLLDFAHTLYNVYSGVLPTKPSTPADFITGSAIDSGMTKLLALLPMAFGAPPVQSLQTVKILWYIAKDLQERNPNAVDNLIDRYIPQVLEGQLNEIVPQDIQSELRSVLGVDLFANSYHELRKVLNSILQNPQSIIPIFDQMIAQTIQESDVKYVSGMKIFNSASLLSVLKDLAITFQPNATPTELLVPPENLQILGFQLYHSEQEIPVRDVSLEKTVAPEDQPYADMVNEVYKKPQERKNMHGYVHEHHSDNHSIYTKNGERVLVLRGTANANDVVTDIGIMKGNYLDTTRFKETIRLAKDRKVTKAVGHSLGGTLAGVVSSDLNIPGVLFNPGSSSNVNLKDYSKIKVYKITGDPVSLTWHKGKVKLLRPKDGINAHSASQFVNRTVV